MKTIKEEKELQPLSIEEAKGIVNRYFKDVRIIHMEIFYPSCGKLVINVSYEDFKPCRLVRDELEKIIPFSEVNVERDISYEQGKKVFFDAWSDCEDWPMLIDGKMRTVSLRDIIYKYLEDKTLQV